MNTWIYWFEPNSRIYFLYICQKDNILCLPIEHAHFINLLAIGSKYSISHQTFSENVENVNKSTLVILCQGSQINQP
jgi:hypothetical protein